jgi:hypothetical protein
MKKRGSIKLMIIAIVLIAIVVSAILLIRHNKKKKEIEELNINILKYMKCLTSCPYEIYENKDRIVLECMSACMDTYFPKEELTDKYEDKLILEQFSNCMILLDTEERFKKCINDKLQEEYYNLLNPETEITAEYNIIDLKIEEANCTVNEATLKIKLQQGGDIEKIVFMFSGGGNSKSVEKTEGLKEGEIKTYEMIYGKEGIPFKPTTVQVGLIIQEKLYLKDKKSC